MSSNPSPNDANQPFDPLIPNGIHQPPLDGPLHQHRPERPNIIWVFGDQHRAQALGLAGDPNVRTPNIDNLAAEGVRFPNAVAGFPLCCPYRGALLTSRYPHHCIPGHEHPLPDGVPTVATAFNQAGYDTAYFGKWHVDGFKERTGRAAWHHVPKHRRGDFKTWIGYENNNSQWDCWVHGHTDDGEEVPLHRLDGYETDELTSMLISDLHDRAARQHDTGQREPFFSVLSVQPPHDPNIAPEDFRHRHTPGNIQLRPNVPHSEVFREEARWKLSGYYAQIENLDWNLGRLRDALYETGLAWNTYIVFFSDHGDMMGSHGQYAKCTAMEESIRVPCIFGGGTPFYARKRGTADPVINHVDMAPTTLGVCGIDKPEWMQGTDFSSYVLPGRPADPDEQASGYIQTTISTGHGPAIDRPWRGVVTRDGWKYVCLEGQPWLMFNLNDDPYEQCNLALYGHAKEKRYELQAELAAWIQRTGDSFELPDIWLDQWGEPPTPRKAP